MAYELSFGQWILNRRKELRLQRTELAAQIACATITLRKIETDERRPSQQLAEQLAERLGVPASERAIFVRVARGELPADRLPTLPPAHTSAAPASPDVVATQRELIPAPLRTNLPAPLTSFVGRDQELQAIPALLESQRLVTLTGVGGVGKTRLAIEVGIRMVRQGQPSVARDGIWIVELAALADSKLVAQAIAQTFRLAEQSGRTTLELLQEHLADQQLLLIFDNCEHLIDLCAEIAEQLLLRCWQLHILATSREPLRLPGEQIYPIQPLTLPEPNELQPARILTTTAAQLFIARMHAAPVDQSDSSAAAAIAQICRQLDGIPLALELAAPLADSMALDEIATQLQNQMAILTNTYRTAIPRHQTMHSALVWSYRLLAPEQQRLLASVAVFAGGWTLEAAQAVCSDTPPERVLSTLMQLIAKSLVLPEESHGQRRYRLLEPVRQFAQAQLAASSTEDAARRRHAAYFLSLAEQMYYARDTSREAEWLDRLEPERDNLRAVNAWTIARGEAELAHRFNGWLFAFWLYRSSHVEARRWLDAVLTLSASVLTPEARAAEALALATAGYLAVGQRNYTYAESCFQRGLAIHTQVDHQPGIAESYCGLGFTAMLRGDLAQAEVLTTRGLLVAQAVHAHAIIAWVLFDLGYLALVRGDFTQAQTLLTQALPALREQDISFGIYRALIAFGHVMRALNDTESANQHYREALQIQQRMHYTQVASDALGALAGLAVAHGDPTRAAVLFGADRAYQEIYGITRWPHLDEIYAHDLALARSQLDPEQLEAAWEQGYAMTLDEAVAYALLP
jgi:non-specific serine/threonine protein kinase